MKHYHFAKFEIGTELTGWKCWLPGSSFTSHPTGRIVCNVADIMFGVSDDWCAYIRTEEGIPFSFSSENDSSVAIDESEMLCFCFSLFSLSLSLSIFYFLFCFVFVWLCYTDRTWNARNDYCYFWTKSIRILTRWAWSDLWSAMYKDGIPMTNQLEPLTQVRFARRTLVDK